MLVSVLPFANVGASVEPGVFTLAVLLVVVGIVEISDVVSVCVTYSAVGAESILEVAFPDGTTVFLDQCSDAIFPSVAPLSEIVVVSRISLHWLVFAFCAIGLNELEGSHDVALIGFSDSVLSDEILEVLATFRYFFSESLDVSLEFLDCHVLGEVVCLGVTFNLSELVFLVLYVSLQPVDFHLLTV